MNDTTPPPLPQPKHIRPWIKVSFPMDRALHDEIAAALTDISCELGLELTMPKFLRKTVAEGWRVQAERYRKLNPHLKK